MQFLLHPHSLPHTPSTCSSCVTILILLYHDCNLHVIDVLLLLCVRIFFFFLFCVAYSCSCSFDVVFVVLLFLALLVFVFAFSFVGFQMFSLRFGLLCFGVFSLSLNIRILKLSSSSSSSPPSQSALASSSCYMVVVFLLPCCYLQYICLLVLLPVHVHLAIPKGKRKSAQNYVEPLVNWSAAQNNVCAVLPALPFCAPTRPAICFALPSCLLALVDVCLSVRRNPLVKCEWRTASSDFKHRITRTFTKLGIVNAMHAVIRVGNAFVMWRMRVCFPMGSRKSC
mgnify:CR=1 FL=1